MAYAHNDYLLERITNDYNPEHDLILGAPKVTYTDHVLTELITELRDRVAKLEARVEELEDETSETESKRQLAESVAIWLPTK
jgi:predicted nucleic acid-binding protein